MSKDPIIAVSGVTRCGSTMMMGMLAAGGMDLCEENDVSHEDPRVLSLPRHHEWLSCAEGKAVKLLDIHQFTPPMGRKYLFIYMSRDPKQQAKSMQKFLIAVGVIKRDLSKRDMARLVESIRRDTTKGLEICRERGPVLEMTFEGVLRGPSNSALRVHDFILDNADVVLDTKAMAESVIVRPTECLDYMLELELAVRAETP